MKPTDSTDFYERLCDELKAHPTAIPPLVDLLDFLKSGEWGSFELAIKRGRVVHYLKQISRTVNLHTSGQGEERSQAHNDKER